MQGESAQHPGVADVVWRVLASLERVRDAFGVTLQPEIDACNRVRDDAGAVFHGGDEGSQGFVEFSGEKRVLGLFVLREIGEAWLCRMRRIVLEGEKFFERVAVQEKWRLPDGSCANESLFDEIAPFQEVLSAVLVRLLYEMEGILTLTTKRKPGL
jgi:hypothetical protein